MAGLGGAKQALIQRVSSTQYIRRVRSRNKDSADACIFPQFCKNLNIYIIKYNSTKGYSWALICLLCFNINMI